LEILPAQKVPDRSRYLEREVRPLAGVIKCTFRSDLCEWNRLGAAAAEILFTQRLVAAVFECELLQRMRRSRRIEQIARKHRVGLDPLQQDAVPLEDDGVKLQIGTDLGDP